MLRNGIITVDDTHLTRALGSMLASRALLLFQLDAEWRAATARARRREQRRAATTPTGTAAAGTGTGAP